MIHSLRRFVLAFALYVALVLDGSLSFYLHQFMVIGNGACLILPIGVMLIALFDDTNEKEIWLALIVGIISDLYFWGFIGIYAVGLPFCCWLLQKVARFLPEVFWVKILVVLLTLAVLNIYSWLVLNIVGLINVSIRAMLAGILPTLGWSLIFTLLSYPIWAKLAQSYPFMVNLDNYR